VNNRKRSGQTRLASGSDLRRLEFRGSRRAAGRPMNARWASILGFSGRWLQCFANARALAAAHGRRGMRRGLPQDPHKRSSEEGVGAECPASTFRTGPMRTREGDSTASSTAGSLHPSRPAQATAPGFFCWVARAKDLGDQADLYSRWCLLAAR